MSNILLVNVGISNFNEEKSNFSLFVNFFELLNLFRISLSLNKSLNLFKSIFDLFFGEVVDVDAKNLL